MSEQIPFDPSGITADDVVFVRTLTDEGGGCRYSTTFRYNPKHVRAMSDHVEASIPFLQISFPTVKRAVAKVKKADEVWTEDLYKHQFCYIETKTGTTTLYFTAWLDANAQAAV